MKVRAFLTSSALATPKSIMYDFVGESNKIRETCKKQDAAAQDQ
ncbi:MAG TPA: hypothetical protein VLK23_10885 [Thermodesulfobacteriota bacterium]|nr:hypothetical protein [Thermodesulfobacteriota bacterium]